ncbi:MAG: hypothetical protein J1E38_00200 [Paramuribaculum sp.]|nr:hypothetical protein [Paramuribaculum sp.]
MKLNKYGFLSLIAGLALSFSACTDEAKYDPAEQLANDQVFFATTEPTDVNLEADQTVIPVTISRVKSNGDLTVSLTSSATDQKGAPVSIFSIPSSVTFSSGQSTATINVGVDFGSVDPSDIYTVSITIDGESSTPYGKKVLVMDVYYAPWSDWELVGDDEYAIGFFSILGEAYQFSVFERHSLMDENQIQYLIPSSETAETMSEDYGDYEIYSLWDNGVDFVVNLDKATNYLRVALATSDLNGTVSGEPVLIRYCDMYTFTTAVINSANYPPASYEKTSYFNPETGVLTIDMAWIGITSAGGVGIFDMGPSTIQLPGYPDISINGTFAGSYVADNGAEYALINITKGEDVASYAITMVSGWLEGNQQAIQAIADELVADTEATLYTESQQFQFRVTDDNDYTVVAVVYNEAGEVVGNSAFSFYYELVQRDWTVVTEKALFTDGWWLLDTDEPESWTVTVQESNYADGYYRVIRPYGSCPFLAPSSTEAGTYYIEIDATNPKAVEVYPAYCEIGYNIASIGSAFGYPGPGTFDGNTISFPGGSLLVYYGSYGWVYFNDEDSDILVLDPSASATAQASAKSRAIAPLKVELQKKVAKKAIKGANPRLVMPTSIDSKKIRDYKFNNVKTGFSIR